MKKSDRIELIKKLFNERKERLIISALVFTAVVAVIICTVLIAGEASKGTNEKIDPEFEEMNEAPSSPDGKKPDYYPQSPNSLEFKSLGEGKCSVLSMGGYEGAELVIPEKSPYGEAVVSISTRAFAECKGIISIHIPKTVRQIGDNAFLGCSSLITFSVDRENKYYTSQGGILYSKDKTKLICCPPSRVSSSYLIDPNVTSISDNAFSGAKNLERILYEGSPYEFEKIRIGKGNGVFDSLPITCNYINGK